MPPYSIDQKESVKYVVEYFCPSDEERRLVPALYRMAGIKKRHSVLLKAPEEAPEAERHPFMPIPRYANDKGPTVGERMRKYQDEAWPLVREAVTKALEESESAPADLTHLITVSCSGFYAPGVDVAMIREFGLRPTIERTHVGFMGCHGALNGLRVANGFVRSNAKARVLLCAVELCSLHYHYGWDPQKIVANAIFGDGAAALVGAHSENGSAWRVAASGSCLIPDSEDAMTWRIDDHGFAMSLSAQVPGLIEANLRSWMEGWLLENGLTLGDVQSWAIHPGGPRIINSSAKALDIDMSRLEISRQVLREFGNMSSPTILFILDRLRKQDAPRPAVALAFGPGLIAEATLFV